MLPCFGSLEILAHATLDISFLSQVDMAVGMEVPFYAFLS
jgi:hypothetical protein